MKIIDSGHGYPLQVWNLAPSVAPAFAVRVAWPLPAESVAEPATRVGAGAGAGICSTCSLHAATAGFSVAAVVGALMAIKITAMRATAAASVALVVMR